MSLLKSRQQAGAGWHSSNSAPECRRRVCRVIVCASSRSSGSPDSAARDAQAAAERVLKDAKGRWQKFAKDQNLEQRAAEAMATAREAADKAKDKARRAFVQLDSEYELTSKTARAAKRAEEVARDIDQSYGVRRKLRSARDYVVRMWPTWQRQLDSFTATWYGKATVFFGICLLVSSPIFWSILNVILLLWWLSVPLSLFLIDYARKQQAQRLQEEAERLERERRAANPFADMFSGAWDAAGKGGAGGSGRASGGANRSGYTQQDGPIIEAEWTSIDEGDGAGSGKGRGKR